MIYRLDYTPFTNSYVQTASTDPLWECCDTPVSCVEFLYLHLKGGGDFDSSFPCGGYSQPPSRWPFNAFSVV